MIRRFFYNNYVKRAKIQARYLHTIKGVSSLSLLIAIKHRDGIVLSADSRVTVRNNDVISYYDTVNKIIPCGNNAISFCGDTYIQAENKYIDSFLRVFAKENFNLDVCDLSSKLLHYFISDDGTDSVFFIAGIHDSIPYIYRLETINNRLDLVWGSLDYGAAHNGHNSIVSEAFQDVPFNTMDFNMAIQLAESGINITTEAYKYKTEQCVGGLAEVYVIPIDGDPYWHKHKILR